MVLRAVKVHGAERCPNGLRPCPNGPVRTDLPERAPTNLKSPIPNLPGLARTGSSDARTGSYKSPISNPQSSPPCPNGLLQISNLQSPIFPAMPERALPMPERACPHGPARMGSYKSQISNPQSLGSN